MGLKKYFVRKMLKKWDENDKKRFSGKTFPDGILCEKNISYCKDGIQGHLLDIYYSENPSENMPVIIDIHGGGFMGSDKELNKLYGYALAKRGFLVFNVNYRLAFSDTKIPGQIRDISMAVEWISRHLGQYGGDRDNVILSGHSAGGVLALMEVLVSGNERLQELFRVAGKKSLRYKGIAIDCGMMSFYKKSIGYWGMRSMCFDKGYSKQAYYQSMIWEKNTDLNSLPKIFLISNEKDELKHMTFEFNEILEKTNVPHKLNFQTDNVLGHMAVIYDPEAAHCAEIIDDMVNYLLNI